MRKELLSLGPLRPIANISDFRRVIEQDLLIVQ